MEDLKELWAGFDSYTLDLEGFSADHRDALKLLFQCLINNNSEKDALNAIRSKGLAASFALSPKELMEEMVKKHMPIKKYFFNKEMGKQLQKIDSDIAEYCMLKMIDQYDALILPVHDSFIVQQDKIHILKEVMIEAYNKFVGGKVHIDEKGFNSALKAQKDRSRKASTMEVQDWVVVHDSKGSTFLGYDELESDVKISKYREINQKGKIFYQLVLDKTPFYPEGGGQIGDQGTLTFEDNRTIIYNTKKENNLIVHFTKDLPKDLTKVFKASVNHIKRSNSSKNHTATHLLHHALKSVLGMHVEQKGSLVQPNSLRFDFSHFSKVNNDELDKIEALVLQNIEANIALEEFRNMPIDQAKEMGATALFGEKYGKEVRVIKFNDSIELCGGTHVASTNIIGMFKITAETAVASGVRRIEAICGDAANTYFRERTREYEAAASLLNKPKNLEQSIQDLLSKNQELSKQVENFQKENAKRIKATLIDQVRKIKDFNFLSAIVELPSSSVKDILFQLKGELNNFVGVIGNIDGDKCGLHIILSDSLVKEKAFNASKWIKEISHHIQGGGGGQAFYASAGGKNAAGIPQAIKDLESKI